MSELESAATIESKVGAKRHSIKHLGRAVTGEQRVYILHSEACCRSMPDLRECGFSRALDRGIKINDWEGFMDVPIVLGIDPDDVLCPAEVARERAESPTWPDHSEPITYIPAAIEDGGN